MIPANAGISLPVKGCASRRSEPLTEWTLYPRRQPSPDCFSIRGGTPPGEGTPVMQGLEGLTGVLYSRYELSSLRDFKEGSEDADF